jgi:hypothetical protein
MVDVSKYCGYCFNFLFRNYDGRYLNTHSPPVKVHHTSFNHNRVKRP